MRCRLKLKQYEYKDPDGIRIHELTQKNIESFNGYVDDFHESINIIKQNLETASNDGDKRMRLNQDIEYIENKIVELSLAMKRMADDMPFLVELEVVETE